MTKDDVDRWLEAYVRAWKTYEREAIAALFADDVSYRYHPYDEPIVGRDAVVGSWLGEGEPAGASTRDQPGTYEANYRTVAVDGDVVAQAVQSHPQGLQLVNVVCSTGQPCARIYRSQPYPKHG